MTWKKIIISRVDNLGDVVLTFPLIAILKKHYAGITISFLGKSYTKDLIKTNLYIDEFLDWDIIRKLPVKEQIKIFQLTEADIIIHVFPHKKIAKIASKARIPIRIGTSHRIYNNIYCNKRVHFTRRRSDLHEIQLNIKLLEPLGIAQLFNLDEIPQYYGISKIEPLPENLSGLLSSSKFNLLLHPKSKGSAREWGLENFSQLIAMLPQEKYKIFITGTIEEADLMKEFLYKFQERITDLTGKLSLSELISFINSADGIVAASTGPLHIAAALGKYALGLYAPMHPIHPGRWAPVGINSTFLVLDKECNDCRKSHDCHCIRSITPEQVFKKLKSFT
ncbi:MAG: glycosyltransferase family 9 protein [Bacteroidia bacterium]|nr:glycosyltransferase family 9 protein [Bacteroidia bacterium]